MTALRPLLGLACFATACVAQDPAQTTFPQGWGPQAQQISGPPGGQMDPGYGYQQPDQPGYPQGYPDGYAAPSTEDEAASGTAEDAQPEPSADPNDAGYVMGGVSDAEIDTTLEPYGSWEDNEDYGRVWRPNTTVVGVDFTPYETCGSWVWSDMGWNYSCDWGWGWLPFHYGRWGWFDGDAGSYWGWVPGHEWGPGWVDWRHGGGYVGWRPTLPNVRDHRGEHNTPTFHDHRTAHATAHDAHWRFAAENDFGRTHIRGHLFQNPSEGLRVTQSVTRPNLRGNYAAVSSASLMRARLSSNASTRAQGGWRQPPHQQPSPYQQNPRAQPTWNRANEQPTWQRQQSFQRPQQQPTWQRPAQQQPTWQRPTQQQPTWQRPAQQQPTWQRPAQQQPTWQRPQPTYQRPQQTHAPAPTWHAPAQTYQPSRSSSWSAPSHSSGGGGGYHPSGGGGGGSHSSGGGGGGHSSGGGGGHSGGGGGHHR